MQISEESRPVAVTRARAAARAASSARTLRMMNRPQPAHANGFRFRRARRLFFGVAAVLIRIFRRQVPRDWSIWTASLMLVRSPRYGGQRSVDHRHLGACSRSLDLD